MFIIPWLDRVNFKDQINNWLVGGSKVFLLVVKEPAEIDDVVIWFKENADSAIEFALIALTSDSEVTKINLIDSIVQEFGNERFPNFVSAREKILANIPPCIDIQQNIGTNITANTSEVNGNEAYININGFDLISYRRFYMEDNFDEIFNGFKNDLTNLILAKESKIRIICKFLAGGFDRLDIGFKLWFKEKFISYLKNLSIKTIIICEHRSGDLDGKFDRNIRGFLDDFTIDDIAPLCREHLNDENANFADGAINPDSGTITYYDFKNRFQRKLSILNK